MNRYERKLTGRGLLSTVTVTNTVHTVSTSTILGSTVTTTTCGNGPATTIVVTTNGKVSVTTNTAQTTSIATDTTTLAPTVGRRAVARQPACFAHAESPAQIAAACRCIGAPVHETILPQTAPPMARGLAATVTSTVTKTVTSHTSVTVAAATVQVPIQDFYIQARSHVANSSDMYARVIGDTYGTPFYG